ncbi:hypothetical protein [Rosenbergiella epipactidis]|nr:hypothetical protein [Rosenbergiella epipactidis]
MSNILEVIKKNNSSVKPSQKVSAKELDILNAGGGMGGHCQGGGHW